MTFFGGDAGNARHENARHENVAQTCRWGGVKMQDWKMWHKPSAVENAEKEKGDEKSKECRVSNIFCGSTLRSN